MIDVGKLVAAGIAPTQAKAFAAPLADACGHFEINTPVREAAFVAQCAHESASFTHLEESLFYRTPERIRAMWPSRVTSMQAAAQLCGHPQQLANLVYANRNGNGDESSGDGWRYRGRGLIQLTGRANYLAAESAIGEPYKTFPDMVALAQHACMTAAWYFVAAGCLPLADVSDIVGITRKINGIGMAGLDDRRQRFEEAVRAFQ